MAIHIVLVEPEIPQNTGNIIRTCACTGAGLDYIDLVEIKYYDSFAHFEKENPGEYFLFSTKATRLYTEASYPQDCYLIFGKETAGLDASIREKYRSDLVKLPMIPSERIRSLNLANTVCVAVFEVIRQQSLS